MRFTVRGDHPTPRWRPGDRHPLKDTPCVLRGRFSGRISHAYNDPELGLRCYVVLASGQTGWVPFTELAT